MDYFQSAWAVTIGLEAGYSNRPPDPETMWGVTVAVARAHGYTGPMKDLPIETARQIAKGEYWDTLMLDQVAALSAPIAAKLFDQHYNMWSHAPGTFLQRSLNALDHGGADFPDITVDGSIRALTISALAAFLKKRGQEGELVMLKCLNGLQVADYMRQVEQTPTKESSFYGWIDKRVSL